jgi:SOS response regulatory protein OraA/RecX
MFRMAFCKIAQGGLLVVRVDEDRPVARRLNGLEQRSDAGQGRIIAGQIQELAVRAFQAVDCTGLARVDFLMDPSSNKIFVNEINTMPGFTSISMYPKLWEASGLPYSQLISRLIEDNYLNEERFAISYASGHARIKKWGKIKITHGLRQKGISAFCIKRALQLIDVDEYQLGLQKLAEQKWHLLKKEPVLKRRFKCRQFLLQRGFESALVYEILKIVEEA